MLVSTLAALLIAQVPAPQPAPEAPSSASLPSPVVGVADFTGGFGSASWYGAPSPTIDCTAAASGGDLTCTGATASKSGSPTTVGSPFWPNGWSGAQQGAVKLGGASDWYSLGDVGDGHSGAMTWCAQFYASSASDAFVFSKDNPGVARGFELWQSTTNLQLSIFGGGGSTNHTAGAVVVGAWNTWCGSYSFVADTTSLVKQNLNGVATSASNSRGPIADIAANFMIGARDYAASRLPWAGGVARVTEWQGWAASAADLDVMVKSQIGLLATKPAGVALTHARSDATLCGPYPSGEWFWLAPNVPCIHPASGDVPAGVDVYGQVSNLMPNSVSFSGYSQWNGTTTITSGATWVDGYSAMSRLSNVGQPTNTQVGWANALGVTGSVPVTVSVWTNGVSSVGVGTWTNCSSITGCSCGRSDGGACSAAIGPPSQCWATMSNAPSSTVRLWASASMTCVSGGMSLGAIQAGVIGVSTGTSDFRGFQQNVGNRPLPYRETTGSSYLGTASTATSLSAPAALPGPQAWGIFWQGSAADWTPPGLVGLWSLGGQGAGNTATGFINTNGSIVVDSLDASATLLRSTATSPAFTDGSPHSILMSYSGTSGAISVDGSANSGVMSGSGGGISSVNSSLYLGTFYTSNHLNGTISRVVQCRRGSPLCK